MSREMVEIPVQRHSETEKAWLVSDDGDESNAVWIPKSQAELNKRPLPSKVYVLVCPEWLAIEKGLV